MSIDSLAEGEGPENKIWMLRIRDKLHSWVFNDSNKIAITLTATFVLSTIVNSLIAEGGNIGTWPKLLL